MIADAGSLKEECRLTVDGLAAVSFSFGALSDALDQAAGGSLGEAPAADRGREREPNRLREAGAQRRQIRIGPIADLADLFRILAFIAGTPGLEWVGDRRFVQGFFFGTLDGAVERLEKVVREAVPGASLEPAPEGLVLRLPAGKGGGS
ncbi:MAG: hypothetical protein M0031_12660 [Thermaerobacter sp.]|jgi:hypothetical protein|nr:hypothetical protein [Thermaerobacter sp.]